MREEKRKQRVKKLKKELIKMLGGKCEHCGRVDPRVLEFHHKNGKIDKKERVPTLIHSGSKVLAIAEAKKCVLLCRNCHMMLHNKGRVRKSPSAKREARYKAGYIEQMGGKCKRCRRQFDNELYEFHHVGARETKSAYGLMRIGKAKRDKEVAKCVLLCPNCHQIVHAEGRE